MTVLIRKIGFIVTIIILEIYTATSYAKDAREIMEESESRSRPDNFYSEYRIEVFDHDKLISTKHLMRMDKKTMNGRFTLLRFTQPFSIKGSSFLVENIEARESNIWSYMPSTKLLRKISGTQKQNWFMGTDFTYEDFEYYMTSSHSFELIKRNQNLEEKSEIVIDAYPTRNIEVKSSGYSKKRYFLNSDTLYPTVIEYYDSDMQLARKLVSENLKITDGITIPGLQTMYNYKQNSKTVIISSKNQINKEIPDSYFTPKYLRNQD